MSPEEIRSFERLEMAHAVTMAAKARYPLAMARLWHRDPPRTSQRAAFTADIAELLHGVLGGMGSGKTEGAIQVDAAMARGRNDPEVQVWARANGFPLARIPPDPKLIIVSAGSHQLSAVTLRPLFAQYMPLGTEYRFWASKTNEASAFLPNGCEARFMAETQNLKQFNAMNAQFAHMDEQHREEIVDAVLQRVSRSSWSGSTGYALFSATPQTALVDPNMAWMPQRFEVERRDGYRMTHIYGLDNPYLDRVARERLLVGMSAAKRAMEDRGAWYNPGGMVFERYQRGIHVVPPAVVPADWQRIGGLDIGTSAPTAYLATAYDAMNDVLHVYTGYYGRHPEPEHHAREILNAHSAKGEGLAPTVLADQQTPGAIETLIKYKDAGVHTQPADKTFAAGVASTNSRMDVRQRGRMGRTNPGLVIHDVPELQPLIREIQLLSWKPNHVQLNGETSRATQGADHACDVLRYICHELWITQRGS